MKKKMEWYVPYWKAMHENKKNLLVTAQVVIVVAVTLFTIVWFLQTAYRFFVPKVIETVVITPSQMRCISQGLEGWKLVQKGQEMHISKLHKAGKVRYLEAPTLECVDFSDKHLTKIYLNERWYQRGKQWKR